MQSIPFCFALSVQVAHAIFSSMSTWLQKLEEEEAKWREGEEGKELERERGEREREREREGESI